MRWRVTVSRKGEIDFWCVNEGYDLPVYLFANKCDLLTEVQDSFLAGARMERTCREAVSLEGSGNGPGGCDCGCRCRSRRRPTRQIVVVARGRKRA